MSTYPPRSTVALPSSVRVWALRHGESRANAEGLIVSRPGADAFVWAGLTPLGREQAAAVVAPEDLPDPAAAIVITSDFARAAETAEVVGRSWGARGARVDTRLRERDFGKLEGHETRHYDSVWQQDTDQLVSEWDVESPYAVAGRITSLLTELADEYRAPGHPHGVSPHGVDLVLSSHGDVLQIAQALLSGVPVHQHRGLEHLHNAELRRLF